MTIRPKPTLTRPREGSAVIVVLALLVLLLMFSTANLVTLDLLHGELDLLERRHQQRIAPVADGDHTNLPPVPERDETKDDGPA